MRPHRVAAILLVAAFLFLTMPGTATAHSRDAASFTGMLFGGPHSTPPAAHPALLASADMKDSPFDGVRWAWPVTGPQIVREHFRAPAQPWSSGHRGMDVAVLDDDVVRSPASGIVAFSGTVVDRPLITIAHPGGLVTTLEPVASELMPGDPVSAGQPVGTLATGGHTPPGALHVGVRWHGAYINPLLLFGGVPRAVLLPCCE